MTGLMYFVLGVCTVLLIGGVVYLFNLGKSIKKLKEFETLTIQELGDIKKDYSEQVRNVWSTFNTAQKEHEAINDNVYREMDSRLETVYREMDSRLDKLANKFQLKVKETEKQIIND